MSVHIDDVLRAATVELMANPCASMTEIAAAAGISRSTLHARFAGRRELIVALANDALDLAAAAYAAADLSADDSFEEVVRRLVELLIPLGSRMQLLGTFGSFALSDETMAKYLGLDRELISVIEAAQRRGQVDLLTPAWWVSGMVHATVWSAWCWIEMGMLAPRSAPELVSRTVLYGVTPQEIVKQHAKQEPTE